MGRLFGTDGVRGVANSELTPELAYKIGRAGAYVLTCETHHKSRILVGRDTRISGGMLEAALIAGICSVGAEAVSTGVIPTPAIAHLVRTEGFDAGVMISASHNPFEHNGIKFFSGTGYKLRDEIEDKIEEIIANGLDSVDRPTDEKVGTLVYDTTLCDKYIDFAVSTVNGDLSGIKVAIDCANGASSVTAERALKKLGAEVFVINNKPSGLNINDNCGSTHMEQISEFAKSVGADIGLAFDGDADRVLAVDEKGNTIDGDRIMTILALDMKNRGVLKQDTVVATVMSNLGFFVMGEEHGLKIPRTKVGDRYVLEEMLKSGYNLGGEQSGHVILLDFNTTGDGLVTGLTLLSALKKSGKKLSELASLMTVYPQVLVNARVKNENKELYESDPEITAEIQKLEAEFKSSGRVLIRPSGTEPLVCVMIEGKDKELITRRASELADLIVKKFG